MNYEDCLSVSNEIKNYLPVVIDDDFSHKITLILLLFPMGDKKLNMLKNLPESKKMGYIIRYIVGLAKIHQIDEGLLELRNNLKSIAKYKKRKSNKLFEELKKFDKKNEMVFHGYKLILNSKYEGEKSNIYSNILREITMLIFDQLIKKGEFKLENQINYYKEKYKIK